VDNLLFACSVLNVACLTHLMVPQGVGVCIVVSTSL
jgi:hypothetical protein